MRLVDLALPGPQLVVPDVFEDARGFVFESYNAERYRRAGIDCHFEQDNYSHSVKGALRGLHYQAHLRQAKLVSVASGQILDVAVDIRPDSPTLGRWVSVRLAAEGRHQLYLPAGFAHGFCLLSESADVIYKLSTAYRADLERCLAYDDAELAIDWPVREPIVSERDAAAESFAAYRARVTRRERP
jgi:dTDP-4-dehydrorhamnose 3,5-epimerase